MAPSSEAHHLLSSHVPTVELIQRKPFISRVNLNIPN